MAHCSACKTKAKCTIEGCVIFGGHFRTSSYCKIDTPQCVAVIHHSTYAAVQDTKSTKVLVMSPTMFIKFVNSDLVQSR
jgi:hypothetical protein